MPLPLAEAKRLSRANLPRSRFHDAELMQCPIGARSVQGVAVTFKCGPNAQYQLALGVTALTAREVGALVKLRSAAPQIDRSMPVA